jgi:hypothetical protein
VTVIAIATGTEIETGTGKGRGTGIRRIGTETSIGTENGTATGSGIGTGKGRKSATERGGRFALVLLSFYLSLSFFFFPYSWIVGANRRCRFGRKERRKTSGRGESERRGRRMRRNGRRGRSASGRENESANESVRGRGTGSESERERRIGTEIRTGAVPNVIGGKTTAAGNCFFVLLIGAIYRCVAICASHGGHRDADKQQMEIVSDLLDPSAAKPADDVPVDVYLKRVEEQMQLVQV